MSDKEIELTLDHQEFALKKIENVRTELLFDFVQKLKLQSRVDNKFFLELAHNHIKNNKYHEAALIIHKFKFKEHFDCHLILEKLVDSNRITAAKQICELDESFKLFLIKLLSTNENCKMASQLIKEFRFDINDFPELKERLMKSSMRFYLGRFLYKKPG